jgi:hypothetical protein
VLPFRARRMRSCGSLGGDSGAHAIVRPLGGGRVDLLLDPNKIQSLCGAGEVLWARLELRRRRRLVSAAFHCACRWSSEFVQ